MKKILLPQTPSIEEALKKDFSYVEYIVGKEKKTIPEIYQNTKRYEEVLKQILSFSYVDSVIELQKQYEIDKKDITNDIKEKALEIAIILLDADMQDLESNQKKVVQKIDVIKGTYNTIDDLEYRFALQKKKLDAHKNSVKRARAYTEGKISVGHLKPADIKHIEFQNRKNILMAQKIIKEANKAGFDLEDLTFAEQFEFLKNKGFIDKKGHPKEIKE
mgnify:FL=1